MATVAEGRLDGATAEEAQREAERWLDWLVDNGSHGWRKTSPLTADAKPTPHLPCRLLALTSHVEGEGHLPYLMLMAGKRARNRYWQYATVDLETGVPYPMDKALAAITGLVNALATVADIPAPYPRRVAPHV